MLRKWLINHIQNEDGDYIDVVSVYTAQTDKSGGWLKRSLSRFFG
jgi:hemerythrin